SISRHLSVLKDADLIRDQREGKYIFYELNASVLEEVLLWIAEMKGESGDEKEHSESSKTAGPLDAGDAAAAPGGLAAGLGGGRHAGSPLAGGAPHLPRPPPPGEPAP